MSKPLAVLATILLGVAFVIVAFTHGANAKTVSELTLAGLTAFACSHAV